MSALSLLLALAVMTPAAQANTYDEFGIGTRIVDANYVRGPKQVTLEFKPRATGSHVIRLVSASGAGLQFSVFRIPASGEGGIRIGKTGGTDKPRTWKGFLDGSKRYYINVWSSRGSARFTAKVRAVEPMATKTLADPEPSADLTTSPTASWQVDGTANAVVVAGQTMFVGGDFTNVYSKNGGSLPRSYLVGIDRATGEPTSFTPELNGAVWALALSPDQNTLYVGGSFRMAQGQSRKYIAAYDVKTGRLTSFDPPSPNSALRAIAADGKKVYLGGLFTSLGGVRRNYVAAVEAGTGKLDNRFVAWPNDKVNSLVIGIDRLWLGGEFTTIGGVRQKGLGAVDPISGKRQATSDVVYPVIALAVSDTQLFVAGGGPGGRGAAFSRATGAKQWEIESDGNFQAVDTLGGGRFVYFGGHYETIEGNGSVDRLTRHYAKNGKTDVSWLPQVNGMRSINAIDVTGSGIHIGGDFTKVDGEAHRGFAIITGDTR